MAAKIAELTTDRKPFTAEDKRQFAADIKLEKRKLLIMAGAGKIDDKEQIRANLFDLLQAEQYQPVAEIKYAPLRIAVQDALAYSAPEVELDF